MIHQLPYKKQNLRLNQLSPAFGSKKNRARKGRGCGSGLGKTCGRGHKGQHARSGGYHKVGFEGGQMPLQRRLPRYRKLISHRDAQCVSLRLNVLNTLHDETIDLNSLIQSGCVPHHTAQVRIYLKGQITKPVRVRGDSIHLTRGAKAAIEAIGGQVEASCVSS